MNARTPSWLNWPASYRSGWRSSLGLLGRGIALGAALLASGCLERYMVIDSKPQGATVTVDGVEVGKTPVAKLPCPHAGHRRVVVQKKGYKRVIATEPIKGPWYYTFPLDIMTDFLNPFRHRVVHSLSYSLEKAEPVDGEELLTRAKALKNIGLRGPSQARAKFTPGEEAAAIAQASIMAALVVLMVAP